MSKLILRDGAELIAEERKRQISKKGWTPQHDDNHQLGELTEAALCYGLVASAEIRGSCATEWPYELVSSGETLCQWPFEEIAWKPSDDPLRNLVKAGALIAAEIDRLQRAKAKEVKP